MWEEESEGFCEDALDAVTGARSYRPGAHPAPQVASDHHHSAVFLLKAISRERRSNVGSQEVRMRLIEWSLICFAPGVISILIRR